MSESPYGVIGRRAPKIEFRKECWFDSGQGHQKLFRSDPPASAKSLFELVIGLFLSPLPPAPFRWFPVILLVSLLVDRESVGIAIFARNRTHARTQ
jgi:hypothetical protein